METITDPKDLPFKVGDTVWYNGSNFGDDMYPVKGIIEDIQNLNGLCYIINGDACRYWGGFYSTLDELKAALIEEVNAWTE